MDTYDSKFIVQRNLQNLLGLGGAVHDEQLFNTVKKLIKERDEAQSQIRDITKMLVESSMMKRNINSSIESLIEIANAPDTTQLLERCKQASERFKRYGHDSSDIAAMMVEDIPKLVACSFQSRNEIVDLTKRLANAPDTAEPQLSEIRYVLHGDIQPCSVLYSDDTTTLLRLDEGDMMLETDTIEWSGSVTYRCQELLRDEAKRSGHRVSLPTVKTLAQLVRDERITLNDDASSAANQCSVTEFVGTRFFGGQDVETQIAVGTVAEER